MLLHDEINPHQMLFPKVYKQRRATLISTYILDQQKSLKMLSLILILIVFYFSFLLQFSFFNFQQFLLLNLFKFSIVCIYLFVNLRFLQFKFFFSFTAQNLIMKFVHYFIHSLILTTKCHIYFQQNTKKLQDFVQKLTVPICLLSHAH